LPKYIHKLKEKKEFKNLVIEICDIPREEAFKRLNDGDIDICFYQDKFTTPNLLTVKRQIMFKDKAFIICRKNHPLMKIENLTKKDVEKYPYLFLKSYSTYDPREIFNFTKKDFVFEKLNWDLMKKYLLYNDNILLVTETFSKNMILNNSDYGLIDISKWASLGIYHFLLENVEMKKSLKHFVKIIAE
jgi:hypothetical protein